MTILQDMTRAVERIVGEASTGNAYCIRADQLATLLSHAALARQALDRISNSGLTDALAELLWKADGYRAAGRGRSVPWQEAGEHAHAQFRGLAKAVLLSGLI